MFEIELKNSDEMTIKAKERVVNINVAQSTINADLKVGTIRGSGEFEIGDIAIVGTSLKEGGIMYRIDVDGIKIGIVGNTAKTDDLDNLGPVDILGTSNPKTVSIVEPKIVIPMGNMDFAEIKASVKTEKKLKIKNANSLPAVMEVWKLD
ncbi:hypothetical protein IJV57_04805 [Candidatus Saccharibacteria bacterium]|jgi:hypothetical protein|nr:hypothetical protein [Candidatus Saccharibacteria bacterium]